MRGLRRVRGQRQRRARSTVPVAEPSTASGAEPCSAAAGSACSGACWRCRSGALSGAVVLGPVGAAGALSRRRTVMISANRSIPGSCRSAGRVGIQLLPAPGGLGGTAGTIIDGTRDGSNRRSHSLTRGSRLTKPITGMAACCARAATGHAAAPPSRVMNLRRFIRSPRRRGRGRIRESLGRWLSRL